MTPKGGGGAQVTAQHEKFPDATTVAQLRGFCRERLVALKQIPVGS